MKILLLVSAFNGLTQRVWCHLRDAGHDVGVELAPTHDDVSITRLVSDLDPDLVLCPFLKHRVPQSVWDNWPTVILHPGPAGDRGPSSLDHATLDSRPRWGVTALSAVEAMDAGPIWACHTFDMPESPIPKSALYNSRVADAAMACVEDVLNAVRTKTPPKAVSGYRHPVPDTGELPLLRRKDFAIDWNASPAEVCRRIAAADGAPGAPALLEGEAYCVFDAAPEPGVDAGAPGRLVARDGEKLAVSAGGGLVWFGYAATLADNRRGIKLPASYVLPGAEDLPYRPAPEALREISYSRFGGVGILTVRSYNGAMHTEQCRRMTDAVGKALAEDTHTLVVTGTEHGFSNGINLNVIEASEDPAAEAWANINAIDDFCEAIAQADQLTVAALSANAGAGGVMAALCADVVYARDGIVLNPYYDMGIYGSELHTWGLASRVGEDAAQRLLTEKLPVSSTEARRLGILDAVGPRDWESFAGWLGERLRALEEEWLRDEMRRSAAHRSPSRPFSYYRTIELAEMARDFFDDRNGFAAQRFDFVKKRPTSETPSRLRFK
ncbi:enoyl-CoA hydratase-related protein [Salininema proteolyticum]|uniref:Enoyl-CoA hydratase-related protein n=1 Tax=Salininema proteolyticum TaxID=1607685 RepID=A0ABV8U1L5_9ACTN